MIARTRSSAQAFWQHPPFQKMMFHQHPGICHDGQSCVFKLCAMHTILFWVNGRPREPFPGCSLLGLRMEEVLGDGSCLFRAFSALCTFRTHRQWRELLADRIQNRAEEEDTEQWWLDRANHSLEELLRKKGPYTSWTDFMDDMRKDQWGYVDWQHEFSLEQQAALVSFDSDGAATYIRHRAVAKVKNTFFLVNQKNSQG